jgi:HEAT repeat protein
MMKSSGILFRDVLSHLADQNQPFPAKYLQYFTDMPEEQAGLFADTWKELPNLRKISILEDLDELGEHDTLMDFSAIGKIALEDGDAGVREAAIRLIWECEEKSFIPRVIDLLDKDPSSRVRASAASLMGRFVYMGETDDLPESLNDRVVNSLLKAYKNDPDKLVRRRALESLGYSCREEVTQLIKQAITNNDNEWLASCLYAMGRSADPAWSAIIQKHFTHPDDAVREEAVRAAGELELTHTRETLLDLLENEENEDILAAAIWSLSQIGGKGVRDAINKMAENVDDDELLDFIEDALDNLDFTEELSHFDLLEIDKEDPDENPDQTG